MWNICDLKGSEGRRRRPSGNQVVCSPALRNKIISNACRMFDDFKTKNTLETLDLKSLCQKKKVVGDINQPRVVCRLPQPGHCARLLLPACDLEAELTPSFMPLNQSQSCGVGRSQGCRDSKRFSKSGEGPSKSIIGIHLIPTQPFGIAKVVGFS